MLQPINKTFINTHGASDGNEFSLTRLVPTAPSPLFWSFIAHLRLLDLEVAMAIRLVMMVYRPDSIGCDHSYNRLRNHAFEHQNLRTGLAGFQFGAVTWAKRIDSWLHSGWAHNGDTPTAEDIELEDCEYVLVQYQHIGQGMEVHCLGRIYDMPVHVHISYKNAIDEPYAVAHLKPTQVMAALDRLAGDCDTAPIAAALGIDDPRDPRA